MVSTQARTEIAKMHETRKRDLARFPDGKPLEQGRRDWEAEARLNVLPKGARFLGVDAGGVPAEWMEMPRVAQDRVFLLLHGGGYCSGSPRTHRKLAALLSRATHMRVLTPDYRLAPEHPFPAAAKDGLMAYRWLVEQGFAESNIIVGGDSAGGGLALSILLALREGGAPLPRAGVLLSPWTDLSVSSGSYEKLKTFDPMITRENLLTCARRYMGERDLRHPLVSPLFADLSGLPPLLIHVGGDEVMLDDSRLFAERARAAGVDTTLKIFDGLWHVFHEASPEVPEALQALVEIGEFVRKQFADIAVPEQAG